MKPVQQTDKKSPDRQAFKRAVLEKPPFTLQQGAAALDKHGLGPLKGWELVAANMVNAVFRAATPDGLFYVKIKFRPGFSLEAHTEAVRLVRGATDLPVGDLCILDADDQPFGHPFLVCDALPGQPARDLFESADDAVKRRILHEYGRVVATLHRIDTPGALPRQRTADWRQSIRQNLLDEKELLAALPPEAQARIPTIARLLDTAVAEPPQTPQGFLWGDAVLHNLLTDAAGQITAVLDFENASWGDLLMDQLFIESEFDVRQPRQVYGRPELRDAFWASYEEHGGIRLQPDETYLKIRQTRGGGGLAWFWRAARVLPPRTSQFVEELEDVLRELQP